MSDAKFTHFLLASKTDQDELAEVLEILYKPAGRLTSFRASEMLVVKNNVVGDARVGSTWQYAERCRGMIVVS